MSVKAEMEKLFRRIGGDRESLVSECVDYLAYLSGSDGKITGDETGYIAETFDRRFTPSELKAYIAENHIYSERFERAVPLTLQRLVERDNEAFERQGALASSLSGAYIAAYERLGREFLACDGGTSLQEIEDLSIYLGTLRGYRDRWALFPKDTPDALAAGNGQRTDLLLRELDSLIGLGAVKQEIRSMIHLQEIQRQRRQRGLQEIPISRHLVFTGNPGTGKTTVARLLADIYGEMGILSEGQLIEAERADLVAGYVGQTALKTKAVIQRALGGVLFIDEAYSLAADDYGQESIDTLVKAMEDHRDELVVIAAGYTEPMQRFLDSNPGLRSRFQKYIRFEDFTGAELQEIFRKMCHDAGYIPAPQTLAYISGVFGGSTPGNARDVRNFFQAAVSRQADRLYGAAGLTDEELCSLEPEDVAGLTV